MTSKSDIVISVQGLSKSYTIAHNTVKHTTAAEALVHWAKNPFRRTEQETFWALKDVSFDVQKGDVVGIIGRNGAGKSTLLKVLSRITEPTGGKAILNGRVGSLLEVGTGFHPELTGRENIYMNGAILGMTKREIAKHFDAIVDFAGVAQFLDTPVKRYSSGMYVRLAFAVAAHLNPEILIVDEVLAVGDAEFQKKCLGKMKDVAESGRTVLFVSHNMAAVRSLCKKVLMLESGKVCFSGETNEGITHYTQVGIGASQKSILSALTKCHSDLILKDISINGASNHIVEIDKSNVLDIHIHGKIAKPLRIGLELWLMDTTDMPLAFFGAGHEQGQTPEVPAGFFNIHHKLQLPNRLNQGNYFLTFALTDHNVTGWADLPRCVRLSIEGYPTRTGRPLEYREGKGFVTLAEINSAEAFQQVN